MRLTDLFNLSLIGRASAEAITYDRSDGTCEALTFGDLEERSNRMAQLLTRRGLARGDRLCLFLPNRIEYIDLFLACVKAGVILVPINVLYRDREIVPIINDCDPKAIVTTRDLASLIPNGNNIWEVDELEPAAQDLPGARQEPVIDGDDPAAIIYTSGTTGRSKGAVLTHNNFAANAVNLLASWRISSEDRYLSVLPLFHVHGLGNGVHIWLISGCRMRLVERFELARAYELFDSFHPTLFFGVPTIYVRLLELPAEQAQRIGSRIRLFVSGSAPLPPQVLTAFRQNFGHTILERYGMTETLMNISNPYEGERRPGSVGFPLPGVSVKLFESELMIKGPNVFQGYWRRPDATREAFLDDEDGRWFKTGDLAERSEDGYYTLKGRRSDLIISGGFNIYPREIEEVLEEQPGIREVAVCGRIDERRGEVAVAYIVSDDVLDIAALEDICRRALASFKVPRAFLRVNGLPRNALGKVQKHELPRLAD